MPDGTHDIANNNKSGDDNHRNKDNFHFDVLI